MDYREDSVLAPGCGVVDGGNREGEVGFDNDKDGFGVGSSSIDRRVFMDGMGSGETRES